MSGAGSTKSGSYDYLIKLLLIGDSGMPSTPSPCFHKFY